MAMPCFSAYVSSRSRDVRSHSRHGATGKGNDQVRFELGYYALKPVVRVIAPWCVWDLTSRERLLTYAEKHGIAIEKKKGQRSPYSMDANLLHISYEGVVLEDTWT